MLISLSDEDAKSDDAKPWLEEGHALATVCLLRSFEILDGKRDDSPNRDLNPGDAGDGDTGVS